MKPNMLAVEAGVKALNGARPIMTDEAQRAAIEAVLLAALPHLQTRGVTASDKLAIEARLELCCEPLSSVCSDGGSDIVSVARAIVREVVFVLGETERSPEADSSYQARRAANISHAVPLDGSEKLA